MHIYLIAAVILIVLSLIAVPVLRRVVVNSVEDSLLQKDFAAFDRKIDKWYIKLFIPHFNVDYLKLNRALLAEDREDTDRMFAYFDTVNLTEKQKENVYLRGFEYYLSREDERLTEKYHNLIKGLDSKGHRYKHRQNKQPASLRSGLLYISGRHLIKRAVQQPYHTSISAESSGGS